MAEHEGPPGLSAEITVNDGLGELEKWNMASFIVHGPCVRESLMFGICNGLSLGTVSFLFTKHVSRSIDVFVAALTFGSFLSYYHCNYKRTQQIRKMEDWAKGFNAKKAEFEAEEKARREAILAASIAENEKLVASLQEKATSVIETERLTASIIEKEGLATSIIEKEGLAASIIEKEGLTASASNKGNVQTGLL